MPVQMLRFAYDNALIAENEKDLTKMLIKNTTHLNNTI